MTKNIWLVFGLLIIVGSIFRLLGFAPQIAMAVFGAAVIKDKKLAFVLPLFSMLLSDILYEVLYRFGYMPYGGFYEGQVINYLLIIGVAFLGLWAANLKPARIITACLAAPCIYFVLSNFMLWLGNGGYQRPKTFSGLMMCYNDAVPFFRSSLQYTLLFSALLFGGYFFIQRFSLNRKSLISDL